MEFSSQKSHLLKELDLVQGVVEKKTTIPILSNLLLEAGDSGLRISATDMELGVRSSCPAKVKKAGAGPSLSRSWIPFHSSRRRLGSFLGGRFKASF